MDILQAIRLLISKLPIIGGIPFVAAIIAGTLTMLSPKQYKSEVRLSTGYTVTNKFSLTEERFNALNADMKFNNLIEIIKSPILIGALAYKLAVNDLKSDSPFKDNKTQKAENWLQDEFELTQEDVITVLENKIKNFELLSSYNENEKNILEIVWQLGYNPFIVREGLRVQRINYTDYITIQYESKNPLLSAYVVNSLSDEFLRYNSIIRYQQSSESIEFLDTLAQQKKQVLDEKSAQLRNYKSAKKFLNFQLESESKIAQVKDTEAKRDEALNEIRRINLSIASIDDRVTDNSQSEIKVLRSRLAKLNENRRNGVGNYQQTTDSISLISNKLDNLIRSSGTLDKSIMDERYDLNIELQVQEKKLESIEQRLAGLRQQVSSFASSEASIASMERELELASQEYLEVQQKLNDAINANIDSKENIRVLVHGQPALEPESSGTIMKSGFAFAGVMVLCVIAVLGVEFFDPRIKTMARFEQMLDIPLLETIYHDKVYKAPHKKSLIPKLLKGPAVLPFEHAMRKIRYEITSQSGKAILFSSLKQGEGKSFMMYQVAKSLSKIGKRILIIDTNFRDHQFFKSKLEEDQQELEVDVFNLLPLKSVGDGESLEQALVFEDYFIMSKSNENIHIMPNRNPGGSPAEVLARRDFGKMLQTLSETGVYDYFFMEAAAMNQFSDVLELSKYSEKVILVFNGESEFSGQDRYNLQLLDKFEDKILGAVLNQALVQV